MLFKTRHEYYLSELQKQNPEYYEYFLQKQRIREGLKDFSNEQKEDLENALADAFLKEFTISWNQ